MSGGPHTTIPPTSPEFPDRSSRIARGQHTGGDGPSDHAARRYDCVLTDGGTWKHDGACAHEDVPSDRHSILCPTLRQRRVSTCGRRDRVEGSVEDHGVGTDEAPVPDDDGLSGADRRSADPDVVADLESSPRRQGAQDDRMADAECGVTAVGTQDNALTDTEPRAGTDRHQRKPITDEALSDGSCRSSEATLGPKAGDVPRPYVTQQAQGDHRQEAATGRARPRPVPKKPVSTFSATRVEAGAASSA